MSLKFFQEDGKGSVFDEYGNEPVEMEVDNEQFPLEDVTNYDTYMDLKPPERLEKMKIVKAEIVADQGHSQRKYTRYSDEKKERFFHLVYVKGYTVPEAAKELDVPKRTAHYWFKKEEDAAQKRIEQPELAQEEEKEKKKVGRPKILNEEHKGFLLQKYSEDPRATVNEAMESLASQFEGLKIAKTAVHDFMVNDCALTIKKAHFEPKERNSPRSIEARFQWATNLIQTDIDFMSNCIFIDESAFHINLSRTMA
ncbi:hypothetical protein BD560DRAFT_364333 [Blakeslea trispora]|nr:hypothetical protein BD560DRAFT_364333 [Blakeslea trispora]